ncbi:MAG: chromosomal replication initiator protein DnaA, partial [Anaerolineae bacterium]|nr:chromosomal replication initiator protein DnaA [Anaerolineae bacterium]
DRPPRDLQTLEARLRSRFEGGLVIDIQTPELETRAAILYQWAKENNLTLPASTCEMIAAKARANVRELEGIFNQIVATIRLSGAKVTPLLTDDILDGYRRPRHRVTLKHVLETVANHHGLSTDDLIGPKRNGPINQARQIAMYLAREYTTASLPQIGDAFGGRRHSTVLHSCSKVEEEIRTSDAYAGIVNYLRDKLVKLK